MRQSMLREIFLTKVSHKVFDRSNFFFAPGIGTRGCAHWLPGFTEASPGGGTTIVMKRSIGEIIFFSCCLATGRRPPGRVRALRDAPRLGSKLAV